MLGSSYGSTNGASIDPGTGKRYGPNFPAITVKDIVATQRLLLDSLGIDLSPKQVTIAGGGEQRIDLAIPPAQRIATELCRGTTDRDSTGLLVGHLRDADTRQPRAGTVTASAAVPVKATTAITRHAI